jgi:hypothetical protein
MTETRASSMPKEGAVCPVIFYVENLFLSIKHPKPNQPKF